MVLLENNSGNTEHSQETNPEPSDATKMEGKRARNCRNQPEILENQPEITENQPEIVENQPEIGENQPEIVVEKKTRQTQESCT